MKKIKFFIVSILLIFNIYIKLEAQVKKTFDFKLGIGYSHVGTGDIKNTVFENELLYHLDRKLSSSLTLNFSRAKPNRYTLIFYSTQFGINFLFNPI